MNTDSFKVGDLVGWKGRSYYGTYWILESVPLGEGDYGSTHNYLVLRETGSVYWIVLYPGYVHEKLC